MAESPAELRIELDKRGLAELSEPARRLYEAAFRQEAEAAGLIPEVSTNINARIQRALDEYADSLSDSMFQTDLLEREAWRARLGQVPLDDVDKAAMEAVYRENQARLAAETLEQVQVDVEGQVDRLIRDGATEADARLHAKELRDGFWSDGYAQASHASETSAAQNAARIQTAEESLTGAETDGDIVALRYMTKNDARVRPNHAALEGLEMAVDDGRWGTLAPPNGWGCRCELSFITRGQASGKLNDDGTFQSDTPNPAGGPDDATWSQSPVASIGLG